MNEGQDSIRDRQNERLVLVAVADNTFTAQLLGDQLRDAGIGCSIRNREGGAAIVGGISGTFEVFVLEGDAALASDILGAGATPKSLPSPQLPPPPSRPKRRRWWR
ncbi:MAG: DUF2007 domain-containing protein [Dehalococcoidia bacterium]